MQWPTYVVYLCSPQQYTNYYLAPTRKPFCNSQMYIGSCGEMNTGEAVSWSLSRDEWCHMMPIQQKRNCLFFVFASTLVSHTSSVTCHKIEMMTCYKLSGVEEQIVKFPRWESKTTCVPSLRNIIRVFPIQNTYLETISLATIWIPIVMWLENEELFKVSRGHHIHEVLTVHYTLPGLLLHVCFIVWSFYFILSIGGS